MMGRCCLLFYLHRAGSVDSRTTSGEEVKPTCENRIDGRKVTRQQRETPEGQAEYKLFIFLKMYFY